LGTFFAFINLLIHKIRFNLYGSCLFYIQFIAECSALGDWKSLIKARTHTSTQLKVQEGKGRWGIPRMCQKDTQDVGHPECPNACVAASPEQISNYLPSKRYWFINAAHHSTSRGSFLGANISSRIIDINFANVSIKINNKYTYILLYGSIKRIV